MKKLEDLNPESVHNLAILLSYGLELSEKEKMEIQKKPTKWITNMLNSPDLGVFSSMVLFIVDWCRDNEAQLLRKLIPGDTRIFPLDTNIATSEDGRPVDGHYLVVFGLWNEDLIKIHASVNEDFDFMTIKSIEYFDSSDRDKVMHEANMQKFKTSLRKAINNTDYGDVPLSDEEIIEALNAVIAEFPSLESRMHAQRIARAVNEDSPPSAVIRRGMT